MIRKCICITAQQEKDLRRLSKQTGLAIAELIRRAIDSFLKNKGG